MYKRQAVHNPETREIMVTQYRVAENSAVINTLIAAAQNGKKVTVFVELKARFDEENNLATAEMMQAAGIKIIYSIPGLKVHAKVALIRRRGLNGEKIPSYAYISTGNFNEKTATLYADCGLFTCRKDVYKRQAFGLCRHNEHDTQQVRSESRPGGVGYRHDGAVDKRFYLVCFLCGNVNIIASLFELDAQTAEALGDDSQILVRNILNGDFTFRHGLSLIHI